MFVLASLAAVALGRSMQPMGGMVLFLPMLLLFFPMAIAGLAAWDGMTEGFTPLWCGAPALFFLVPMFVLMNDSAWPYLVGYTVIGIVAHLGGVLYHPPTAAWLRQAGRSCPRPPDSSHST